MCGIVGIGFFNDEKPEFEKTRQEAAIFLLTELLQLTEERGKDATGVATLFGDGNIAGLKMAIPSTEFISRYGGTEKDYEGFLKIWRESLEPAKIFIGHCRKSSIGNKWDNVNNHPIKVDSIIGIHNGTLSNHEEIFDKLKCGRDGTVDSEAIMRLIHYYTEKGTLPFTTETLDHVAERLSGPYSVLAFNYRNPYQLACLRDTRPMEFVLIKPFKMLVVASEKKFIDKALYRYNKFTRLYAPELKYPQLYKDDVDYHGMPDDTVAVFDFTMDVKAKTNIKDLITEEKTTRTRLWTAAKAYETGNWNQHNKHNQYNHLNNNKKKAEDQNKKATSYTNGVSSNKKEEKADAPSKGRGGRVWNKALTKYETEEDLEASQQLGSVEINLNNTTTKTITEVAAAEGHEDIADAVVRRMRDKDDDIGNLTASDRDIENHEAQDAMIVESEVVHEGDEGAVEIDPAALEAAEAETTLRKAYESEQDILDALETTTKVKDMDTISMANRLSKLVFKDGFYKGWMGNVKVSDPQNREIMKREAKLESDKATKAIRQYKSYAGGNK